MTFSISEAIRFGWQHTKQHSGLIFQVLLTTFALQVFSALVSNSLKGTLIGVLAMIALSVAQYVVGVGFALIMLRIAQGKHTEFNNIIPPLEVLWRYFAATFLVGLLVVGVMLGIMLLSFAVGAVLGMAVKVLFPVAIIVGVTAGVVAIMYIVARYSMVRFAVLDGAGITASLTRSSEITKAHIWHLLGFIFVLALLNIAGAIVFLVGLLVTVPVSVIAFAHVYEKLHTGSHSH